MACAYNDFQLVQKIVAAGGDVKVDNDWLIRQAMQHDNLEMTKYFVLNSV